VAFGEQIWVCGRLPSHTFSLTREVSTRRNSFQASNSRLGHYREGKHYRPVSPNTVGNEEDPYFLNRELIRLGAFRKRYRPHPRRRPVEATSFSLHRLARTLKKKWGNFAIETLTQSLTRLRDILCIRILAPLSNLG
jgi:hypothetical protein